jgi:hypothetical protein
MANIPHPIRNSEIISLEQAKGLGYLLQPNENYGTRVYHEWWLECYKSRQPFLTITQNTEKQKAVLELDLATSDTRFTESAIREFSKNKKHYQLGITRDRLTIGKIPLHKSLNSLDKMVEVEDENEA